MNQKQQTFFEKMVLSIDKHINLKSQKRAKLYGYIVGVISYVSLISLMAINYPAVLKNSFLILIFAPFVLSSIYIKYNWFSWSNERVLEKQLQNKDPRGCQCDLENLPLYGESYWKEARFWEFYTCIVYEFIYYFFNGCETIVVLSVFWKIFF
jgi:hypothetical protein